MVIRLPKKEMVLPSGMTSSVVILEESRDRHSLVVSAAELFLNCFLFSYVVVRFGIISIKVSLLILVVMASLSLFQILWDYLS